MRILKSNRAIVLWLEFVVGYVKIRIINDTLCKICYHVYNLKNVKNIHGGVLVVCFSLQL